MRNIALAIVAAVLATFLVAYVILGAFGVEFVILSVAYLGIAFGLDYAVRLFNGKRIFPPKEQWTNNEPFFALLSMFAATLVVAMFNWGPALLLPDYPTQEQRGTLSRAVGVIWEGSTSQPDKNSTLKPEPISAHNMWATGTWFWWKATGLYLLLAFICAFYSFHDEAIAAYRRRAESIKVREKARAAGGPVPEHTKGPQRTFGGLLVIELLAELLAGVVTNITTDLFKKKEKK